VHNTFDDHAGIPWIETRLQQISLEVVYRPGIAGRLRPLLRAGAGIFPLQKRVLSLTGFEIDRDEQTALGAILGAGIDLFYVERARLRGSAVAIYRRLSYDRSPEEMHGFQIGAMFNYDF
jgi:hypothetical protein